MAPAVLPACACYVVTPLMLFTHSQQGLARLAVVDDAEKQWAGSKNTAPVKAVSVVAAQRSGDAHRACTHLFAFHSCLCYALQVWAVTCQPSTLCSAIETPCLQPSAAAVQGATATAAVEEKQRKLQSTCGTFGGQGDQQLAWTCQDQLFSPHSLNLLLGMVLLAANSHPMTAHCQQTRVGRPTHKILVCCA